MNEWSNWDQDRRIVHAIDRENQHAGKVAKPGYRSLPLALASDTTAC